MPDQSPAPEQKPRAEVKEKESKEVKEKEVKEVSFKQVPTSKRDPARKSVPPNANRGKDDQGKKRSSSDAMGVVEIIVKKTTLFYNPLIGGSNACAMLIEKHGLDIVLHSVHSSWLIEGYSSKKSKDSSTSDFKKKKFRGPRFLISSPQYKVPVLVTDTDQTTQLT